MVYFYPAGSELSFTQMPDSGYITGPWQVAGHSSVVGCFGETIDVDPLESNITVTATFIEGVTIKVTPLGPTGNIAAVSVQTADEAWCEVLLDQQGFFTVPINSTVKVEAADPLGISNDWHFYTWMDVQVDKPQENPLKFDVSDDIEIKARYVNDYHSADTQRGSGKSFKIDLGELLRVIQFYNTPGYHCQAGTEDGYYPGLSLSHEDCIPHNSDYYRTDNWGVHSQQDWLVSLSELLRIIQFFNGNGYHVSEPASATEDGYLMGQSE